MKSIIKNRKAAFDSTIDSLLLDNKVFQVILKDEKRKLLVDNSYLAIKLGKETALTKMLIIINPECAHCKTIALSCDRLIALNTTELEFNFIFNSSAEISAYLLNIYLQYGSYKAWNAFMYFIEHGINKLKETWNLSSTVQEDAMEIYNIQQKACSELGVEYTPLVIIDNFLLPSIITNHKRFYDIINTYIKSKN